MTFYERLQTETADAQGYLLSAPIIGRALAGQVTVIG